MPTNLCYRELVLPCMLLLSLLPLLAVAVLQQEMKLTAVL
jgi:hypothetical protein